MDEKVKKLLGALSLVHCNAGGYDKSVFRAGALALRNLPDNVYGHDLGQRMWDADDAIRDALREIGVDVEPAHEWPYCWCHGRCKEWRDGGPN